MRIETGAGRDTAGLCAIEWAIGLGRILEQVGEFVEGVRTRRDGGLRFEESAAAEMETRAVRMGWCGYR